LITIVSITEFSIVPLAGLPLTAAMYLNTISSGPASLSEIPISRSNLSTLRIMLRIGSMPSRRLGRLRGPLQFGYPHFDVFNLKRLGRMIHDVLGSP
jgi:hypothetical protein